MKTNRKIRSNHIEKMKKKNTGYVLLILLGVILMLFAGGRLLQIFMNYQQSNSEYKNLNSKFVATDKAKTNAKATIPWDQEIDVDVQALKKQNTDTVGWIYFENEDISYPIMHAKNDDTYLRTTFDKKEAIAGSIFLEAANKTDFSDNHTIIYGHNMRNLSMFGRLRYYRTTQDYYAKHQYFQIITADAKYRYRIFAYANVSEDDEEIYTVPYNTSTDFMTFVSKIEKQTMKKTDVPVNAGDKVITLSTCSTDKHRFVVHAVRVDEKTNSAK